MVQNLIGLNGNPVANQFIITTNDSTYFQSYRTVIAEIHKDNVTLSKMWDFSRTTMKYLNKVLRDYAYMDIQSKRDIERNIKGNLIKVVDTIEL